MSEILCRLADLNANGAKEIVRQDGNRRATMFVVRYEGRTHAYVNSCPHARLPLNWNDDVFFDSTGRYILCANHSARFDAASGQCVSGPCKGLSLTPVEIAVDGDAVVLRQPFPMS
ncbi:MAG: Rieske (2Fe-2S) protein [Alphaproteobacteria bacterium]|nr:Rieske (2Fe-2S) protein [Alphaproteobacteria bacterium]